MYAFVYFANIAIMLSTLFPLNDFLFCTFVPYVRRNALWCACPGNGA